MLGHNVRKPKCVVSPCCETYAHWIEMKVQLRRNHQKHVRRKARLREKLSKMKQHD